MLASLLPAQGVAFAQSKADEYRVKAAFLFNFAQFVEWPADQSAGKERPLTLCSIGDDRIHEALRSTVLGKKVNGSPVTIRFLMHPRDAFGCHVLFVASDEKKIVSAWLPELRNAPMLTVGETADFAEQGGMIRFCLDDDKVRFEINPTAAERASLKISSRLLLLAKNIVGGRKQS